MKIDDECQLPAQVGKLAGHVRHLEQLITQFGSLISVRYRIIPSLPEQERNANPDAYPSDPISLKDAAQLLGVHQSFVYRLIKQGSLRSWKLPGGHRRVSKGDVLTLPEPCPATSPTPVPDGKRRPRRLRVRKEMSRFTQATLERFGIQIGEEEGHGA